MNGANNVGLFAMRRRPPPSRAAPAAARHAPARPRPDPRMRRSRPRFARWSGALGGRHASPSLRHAGQRDGARSIATTLLSPALGVGGRAARELPPRRRPTRGRTAASTFRGIPIAGISGLSPMPRPCSSSASRSASGTPFRSRRPRIPRGAALPEDVTVDNFFPISSQRRPTASRPSCSTTPARSSICCSDLARACSASPGPSGSIRHLPNRGGRVVSERAGVHERGRWRSTSWCTSSAITRTSRTRSSTGRSCSATRRVRRRTTRSRSGRSPTGSRRCIRSTSGRRRDSPTPDKDDIGIFSTLYPARDLLRDHRDDHRPHPRVQRHDAQERLQRHRAQHRQPVRRRGVVDFGRHTRDYSPDSELAGVYTLRGLTPGATVRDLRRRDPGRRVQHAARRPARTRGVLQRRQRKQRLDRRAQPVHARESPPRPARCEDIDIVFNRFTPGAPLPLTDDGSVELALPFRFHMCGTAYEEIVVNANGTVTFGAAERRTSATRFRSSSPVRRRSPALWDDLNPARRRHGHLRGESRRVHGEVHRRARAGPGGAGVGSNTFSITLKRLLSLIDVKYGALSAHDGLAGVTCGGAFTSGFETPVDLSAKSPSSDQPAVPAGGVRAVRGADGRPRRDRRTISRTSRCTSRRPPTTSTLFEPNGSLARARQVSLPFNTIPVAVHRAEPSRRRRLLPLRGTGRPGRSSPRS